MAELLVRQTEPVGVSSEEDGVLTGGESGNRRIGVGGAGTGIGLRPHGGALIVLGYQGESYRVPGGTDSQASTNYFGPQDALCGTWWPEKLRAGLERQASHG